MDRKIREHSLINRLMCVIAFCVFLALIFLSIEMPDDQLRSFNILGRPFQIPVVNLLEYPQTLLADRLRLQRYWRANLHAYFLSRNPQMFERVILPFYLTSQPIKRTSMLAVSEALFREELLFYDLLDHYRIESDSSKAMNVGLLLRKSAIDLLSCVSCALGVGEFIRRRCEPRSVGFLLGEIFLSLSLLGMLFDQQRVSRIVTYRSVVFILQVLLASLPFLLTLISYRNIGSWSFILGLALRHLLLVPLCFADLCDVLVRLTPRDSLFVLSRFLLVLVTVLFLCLWFGLTISISDSSSFSRHSPAVPPSRSIYFLYHLLFNVGYGDTSERSVLSFVLIVCLTLLSCPVLLIVFQKFFEGCP